MKKKVKVKTDKINKTTRVGQEDLLKIQIEKRENLTLYIKIHPSLETYFKNLSIGTGKGIGPISFAKKRYSMMDENNQQLNQAVAYLLDNHDWGNLANESIFLDGSFNPGILRFQDLSKGKKFIIRELVSKDRLETSAKNFMTSLKQFYIDNIKPVQINANLTFTDVQ